MLSGKQMQSPQFTSSCDRGNRADDWMTGRIKIQQVEAKYADPDGCGLDGASFVDPQPFKFCKAAANVNGKQGAAWPT